MSESRVIPFGHGECSCGRAYIIVRPEDRKTGEILAGEDIDLYIADGHEVYCSNCGQLLSLPIEEVLDPERHTKGRSLLDLARWLEENDQKTSD